MYVNSDYSGPATSDISVMNLLIENIEPLLYKYNVNIGFYGHNHVINRQSAVLNRTVIQRSEETIDSEGNVVYYHNNPQATVQMVVGTGGGMYVCMYVYIYNE